AAPVCTDFGTICREMCLRRGDSNGKAQAAVKSESAGTRRSRAAAVLDTAGRPAGTALARRSGGRGFLERRPHGETLVVALQRRHVVRQGTALRRGVQGVADDDVGRGELVAADVLASLEPVVQHLRVVIKRPLPL